MDRFLAAVQGERHAWRPTSFSGSAATTASGKSVSNPAMLRTVSRILKDEGVLAFYNGLTASLQRQFSFAFIRVGCYEPVKQFYLNLLGEGGEVASINPRTIGLRILAAITTCCVGILCTQPMDVVKLRMQAMQTGPLIQKRYTSALSAYPKIYKKEGFRGMWRGTLPNMARNSVVSTSELVSYDLIKSCLLRNSWMKDSLPCHFVSGLGAGLVCALTSCPVDVIKTRIMNSEGVYNGTLHCARVMVKDEGFSSFYKGLAPFYMRVGSWNIVMFVCFEQLKRACTAYGFTK